MCAWNAVFEHLPFRRLSSWVSGGLKEAASSDPLKISGSLVISQETGFNIYPNSATTTPRASVGTAIAHHPSAIYSTFPTQPLTTPHNQPETESLRKPHSTHTTPQLRPEPLGPPAPAADTPIATASAAGINGAPQTELNLLSLFSGPKQRPQGLADRLKAFGWTRVRQVDNSETSGGGWADCLTNDQLFTELKVECARGDWHGVLLAPDCATYTAARWFDIDGNIKSHPTFDDATPADDDGMPRVVRSKPYPDGLPPGMIDPRDVKRLRNAELVTKRAFELARLAHCSPAKATIILENPADKTDKSTNAYSSDLSKLHGSLFNTGTFKQLSDAIPLSSFTTFAMCRFNLEAQKYTTLWFTNDAASILGKLDGPDYHSATTQLTLAKQGGGIPTDPLPRLSLPPTPMSSTSDSAWPSLPPALAARIRSHSSSASRSYLHQLPM